MQELKKGDICIFNNKLDPEQKGLNGKLCRIVIPPSSGATYCNVKFLDDGLSFGPRIDELTLVPDWKLRDMKLDSFGLTKTLLKKFMQTTDNPKKFVNQFFYCNPSKTEGWPVAQKDFQNIPPDEIGGWCEIGELDVPWTDE